MLPLISNQTKSVRNHSVLKTMEKQKQGRADGFRGTIHHSDTAVAASVRGMSPEVTSKHPSAQEQLLFLASKIKESERGKTDLAALGLSHPDASKYLSQ